MKFTLFFLLGFLCVNANSSSLKGNLSEQEGEILSQGRNLYGWFYSLCNKDYVEKDDLTSIQNEAELLLKKARDDLKSSRFLRSFESDLKNLISTLKEILLELEQSVEEPTLKIDEQSELCVQSEEK